MLKEADILACFAERLECMLEQHQARTSEQLHKHLSEYEARLKAASQHWCDMHRCQLLTSNAGTSCMPEFAGAESARDMKLAFKVPQTAFSTMSTPETEPALEPPQLALRKANSQDCLASNLKTLSFFDREEEKKQKARKKSEERAKSLPQVLQEKNTTSALWCLREKVAAVAAHPWFENFFMTLIAGNMAVVILQLEVATSEHKPMEEIFEFQVAHTVFTFLFAVELAARIFARGHAFFWPNPNWAWDYFDFVIVSVSVMEPIVHLLFNHKFQQSSTLRIVRVLRVVARASRMVRLFRLARGFAPLRIMLASLLCSLKSLIWVVILMLFTMTVSGVLFASSVMEYLVAKERSGNSLTIQDLELQASFGSLLRCLLTEYMAITGGMDWGKTARLLEIVDPFWFLTFVSFHVFLFFAFMNVVTGVFCQGAIEGAARDHTIVIDNQM